MHPQLIGISGSPVKISNTDRLVQAVLEALGNVECLVCGYGEECPMSALPWVFGKDARATPDKFYNVEDQAEVWDQAQKLGHELSQRVKFQTSM